MFALPRRYLNHPGSSEVFRYVPDPGRGPEASTIEAGPLGMRLAAAERVIEALDAWHGKAGADDR